jgi:hypothetical protein
MVPISALFQMCIAAGGKRQFAFANRAVVDRKPDRVGGIAIQGNHPVSARLFHVHRVIAPLTISRPTDVKLIRCRRHKVGVIEVGKVLGGSFRTWFCWELFFELFEREAA